jgi:peroxiredoxin
LAEYRDHDSEIRAAGAKLVAISVDGPGKSQAVRNELGLPFPILCDTLRLVVRQWGVYNDREKGGIAKPAVFILDPGRIIRYASVDEVASRVPASEVTRLLGKGLRSSEAHRRVLLPRLTNFVDAVRNSIHFGVREPTDKAE